MLVHRKNTVLKSTNSSPEWAASYTVAVTPVGAVVASAATSATITLESLGSFRIGDKFLRNPGSDNEYSVVAITALDTSAKTITMGVTDFTVAVGDKLVNLGADTEGSATTPAYDAIRSGVFSDSDGGTAATNSIVTCNSTGEYEYWHRGDGRFWEVTRDSSGTPQDVVAGWGGVAGRNNIADYGAVIDGSTDDTTSVQSCVDDTVGSNRAVFVPAGSTVWKGVSVTTAAVQIQGAGLQISQVLSTGDGSSAANRALTVDTFALTPTARNVTQFVLRDMEFKQETNALASGGSIVSIDYSARFIITNVKIRSDSAADLSSAGKALNIGRVDGGDIHALDIGGWDSPGGMFGVGLDIGNGATATTGNFSVTGLLIGRSTIGIRLAEGMTGSTCQTITFIGPKLTINGSGSGVAGSVGIEMNQQCRRIMILSPHIEAYDEGIQILAGRSYCIKGGHINHFNVDSGSRGIVVSGNVDGLELGPMQFGTSEATAIGVELASGITVTKALVQGLYDVDALGANLFVNNSTETGHLDNSMLLLDAAADNGFWFNSDDFSLGDAAVNQDILINFLRAAGTRIFKWDQTNTRFSFNDEVRSSGGFSAADEISMQPAGYFQLGDVTAPGTPAANTCRLYAEDNGAGKTRLVVLMPDGTPTVLATET